MEEFRILIYLLCKVLRLLVFVGGFVWILSVGPDLLFNDPIYTLLVAIFFMLGLDDNA